MRAASWQAIAVLAPNAPSGLPSPAQCTSRTLDPRRCTHHALPSSLPQALPSLPAPPRSNRSAALLQLSKTGKALADAEECIRLRPDWDKGYFRKAAALEALGRMEEVGAEGRGAAGVLRRGPVSAPLAMCSRCKSGVQRWVAVPIHLLVMLPPSRCSPTPNRWPAPAAGAAVLPQLAGAQQGEQAAGGEGAGAGARSCCKECAGLGRKCEMLCRQFCLWSHGQ